MVQRNCGSCKNFSPEEQLKILAADRSNNCLDTTRLSELCPEISPIKDAIKVVLQSMRVHVDSGKCPAPIKQVLNAAPAEQSLCKKTKFA